MASALFELQPNGEASGVIHWYCDEWCRKAEENDYSPVAAGDVEQNTIPEDTRCETCGNVLA